MIRTLLERLGGELYRRIIPNRTSRETYLERYLVLRAFGLQVFLHRFLASDDDDALHNHPWDWAVSLILAGGYREQRLGPDQVVWERNFMPGRLNFLRANSFHRVDLLEDDCWTLFITGPKAQSWGFLDLATREFLPWREHIRRRDDRLASMS
jgi:hypothetical protein